jgi:protein TonB
MMRLGVEFAGFATAALALHLAAFAAVAPDGMAAGGDGGDRAVTMAAPLAGADPALAALVRAWDQPVRVAAPTDPGTAPMPDTAPDDLPPPVADSAPVPLPGLPSMVAPKATPALPRAASDVPDMFARPTTPPVARPRPRPDQRTAPPPAQRASGQGRAGQQGQGASAVRTGEGDTATALAQWGGQIRAAVQRAQARPSSRARGVVQVQLAVTAGGQLAGVSVSATSGNSALDAAALRAVQSARLPRAPDGVSGTHRFNLPVAFR